MSEIEKLDNALIDAADFQAPSADNLNQGQAFKLTRGHWALIAAGFLCLVFISFITIARSVEVSVVTPSLKDPKLLLPQKAEVKIGNWIKLPIGNRVLVLPGDMPVSVSSEGFTTINETIDIGSERHQQHELVLIRLPGKLDIKLTNQATGEDIPPEFLKASVYVDGQQVDGLPGLIENVAAGQREIKVDAPLYRASATALEVRGKDETQVVNLSLQPAWAEYTLSSLPNGAKIVVDGEDLGQTPLTVRLEEGTRRLQLAAQGFKTFEQEVSVVAQEDLTIPQIELELADGTIEVATEPNNAAVILNGEYRGVSPLTLTVAANEPQQLQVYKAGFKRFEQSLSLNPEQLEQQSIKLQTDTIAVSFSVSPADAEIYIDGVRRGKGSQTINLTALPHKVSVRKAGYVSYNNDLIPTRGNSQIVRANLLTKEQHFWSRTPNEYTNRFGHQMVLFKSPGEVKLGSSRREDGRRANEIQYATRLNKHFYVARHETTNKQFRAFQERHSSGNFKRKSLDSGKQPVVNVSWQQAALYCNWLSEKEGLDPFYQTKSGFVSGNNENANGYRLLTEVEWAWLARNKDGNLLTYPWGDNVDSVNSGKPRG